MSFEDLARRLRDECEVSAYQKLVLGFSAGPDSLALLHALHALGQPLLAAHLDHGLRSESATEAQQAAALAASIGVDFVSERVDAAVYAKQHGQSIEEAARELRYHFLFRMADEQGAQAVVVAHHADDQVETVLMHLLRGAGAAGMRGMAPRLLPNPWSRSLPLVRPLLGAWRQEILDYCSAYGLLPVHDASNQDPSYFRNRLRNELVPQLEGLAPGFKRRLANSAELLAADYELLEQLAAEAWRRCSLGKGAGFLQLDRAALLAEPLALQRSLLRRAVAELRPQLRDIDFADVQRALEHIDKARQSRPVDWLAGLSLLVEGDHLWIADWETELPVDWPRAAEVSIRLEVPGQIALNSSWRLQAAVGELTGQDVAHSSDETQARLDGDHAGAELTVRSPRPGDRFQPLGMRSGSMKLSDFFINEKLPQRARAAWPLVCRGDEIIWVAGYRIAHAFRLQANSKKVLHLTLERG